MTSLTPNTKQQQDDAYSPESLARREAAHDLIPGYDRSADGLDDHPISSGDASGKNPNQAVSDAETKPSGYYNNFTGDQKKKLKSINGIHFLRRKGPLGIIIALLLGGGIGITALLSPSLLVIHFKEIMTDKFNTQLASMEVRTTKLISAKIDSTTGGICTTKINLKCKFSSMSVKQVEKFGAAGIEVEYEKRNIVGRAKPINFIFEGNVIDPKDFNNQLRINSNFRSAVSVAYNPKLAGFSDNVWRKFADLRKLVKTANITGSNDAERTANLNNSTKNGSETAPRRVNAGENVDPRCTENCAKHTEESANELNSRADQFTSDSQSGVKSGTIALGEVTKASQTGLSSALNVFKATGVADTACQAYGAVQTVGYAAKTVRAVQLARYAMAFFNMADMIKSGDAKPEDVAYLGGILTNVGYDAVSAVKRGSATDSYGYKYAAFGDTGKMSNFTSQFLVGGGLTGDLINVSNSINSLTGGNAKATCRTLANPWVQAGSLVGGIALMIVPTGAGQAASVLRLAGQAAASIAFSVALLVLPELLKDIVAGNVTEGISGEDSGDAATSGAGVLMGGLANNGGNSPMSKDDALAYNSIQGDILKQNAQDDIARLSPLDTSSRHTFLGSIVASLIPTVSSNTSVVGKSVGTIGSIVSTSMASIFPQSSAVTNEQYGKALDVCQDFDYNELGIATDPFCNVIYGIPPQYLDKDPLVVVDELGGQIDEYTGEPLGEYKTFVSDCIERSEPLGSSGPSQEGNEGKNCIINSSNANYYLNFIDQRIDDGIEGYVEEDNNTATIVPTGNVVSPLNDGFRLTDKFGPRVSPCVGCSTYHLGLDYISASDKSVRAILGGAVTQIGGSSNNIVSIKHADGLISTYWHMRLSDIVVKVGDTVSAGQLIGNPYSEQGQVAGAHLHFELDISEVNDPTAYDGYVKNTARGPGTRIDPQDYFKKNGLSGY